MLVHLVDNDASGLYSVEAVGKTVTLEKAQEPDENRVRVQLKARVFDYEENVTKMGRVSHSTTARCLLPATERPSDDFCNGFVDSNGIDKIAEVDLGQKTASLINAKRFRANVERTGKQSWGQSVSQTLQSETRSRDRSRDAPAYRSRAPVDGLSEVLFVSCEQLCAAAARCC